MARTIMDSRYSEFGFTLIELLIVVVIIGILASIAIPSYQILVDSAKDHACLSEAKAYSNQVFLALNDQESSSLPVSPILDSCKSITDATGWTLATQQVIYAVSRSSANARIECDIPNGTPCMVLY